MRYAALLIPVLGSAAAAQDLPPDDPPPPAPVWEEILRLPARLEALEQAGGSPDSRPEAQPIDLSGEEVPALPPNGNPYPGRYR